MKSRFLLLIVLSIFVCSCSEKKNSLKEINLKGNVRAIEQIDYSIAEKFVEIKKGDMLSIEIYNFSKNGNLLEKKDFWPDAKLRYTMTYKYNEEGNQIGEIRNYSELDHDSYFIFNYDEIGNQTGWKWYGTDGSMHAQCSFKYDTNGNQTERYDYYADGGLEGIQIFKYDGNGNRIERQQYDYYRETNGSLRFIETYKYDDNGNLTEEKTDYSKGSIAKINFKYEEFDKYGNWLLRVKYDDGKPKLITERKIEYYP